MLRITLPKRAASKCTAAAIENITLLETEPVRRCNLAVPYLTLPSGWVVSTSHPALRPYLEFGPMRNPDVNSFLSITDYINTIFWQIFVIQMVLTKKLV